MKKKEICVALVVFGLFLNYNNGYAQKSSSQPPQRPTGQVSFGNKSTTKTINQVGESHFASKPQTTTKSPSFFEKVKSTFGFGDKNSQTEKQLRDVEKKIDIAQKKNQSTTALEGQKQSLLDTKTRRDLKSKEQAEGKLSYDEKMTLERLRGSKWATKQTQFTEQTQGKKNLSTKETQLFEKIKQKQVDAAEKQIKTVENAQKKGKISELEAQVGLTQAELRKQRATSPNPASDPVAQRLEIKAQLAERRFEIEKLQKSGKTETVPLKQKQLQELELAQKMSNYLTDKKLNQLDLYKEEVLEKHQELKDIMEKQKQVRSEIKDIEKQKSPAVKPIEELQERNESQPKKNKDIFTKLKEKPAQEKVEISEKTNIGWQKATPSSEAIIKSIKFIDADAKIGTGRATDTEKSKTSSQEISTQKTKIEQKTELQENESDQEIKQGMSTKKKVAIGAAIGVGAAAIAGAAAGIAVAATQENSSSQTPPQPTAPAPDSETPATDSSSTDTAASDTPNTEPTF